MNQLLYKALALLACHGVVILGQQASILELHSPGTAGVAVSVVLEPAGEPNTAVLTCSNGISPTQSECVRAESIMPRSLSHLHCLFFK